MILTRKQIHEGEMLPHFYGPAWHDFPSGTMICYLWPLNIILAWIRKYWQKIRYYYIKNPLESQAMEAISQREYELRKQGYRRGHYDGEQLSLDKMLDELNRARQAGARDVMNALNKDVGLDPVPDDWNLYKHEEDQ